MVQYHKTKKTALLELSRLKKQSTYQKYNFRIMTSKPYLIRIRKGTNPFKHNLRYETGMKTRRR